MTYSSKLTKKRILSSAKKEFLENGFLKANIRAISKGAKVTTGALYNHFQNKELLFSALVEDVEKEFIKIFEQEHAWCEKGSSYFDPFVQGAFNTGIEKVLHFIYDHFDEVKLLVCHSGGTRHENFEEALVDIEEKSTLTIIKKGGMELTETDILFIHVMSTSGITNMFEMVRHDLTKEQAFAYMEKLQKFHTSGWEDILG